MNHLTNKYSPIQNSHRRLAKLCNSLLLLAIPLLAIPATAQVNGPERLDNGDFRISYAGTPDQDYTAERTDDLASPVEWTPLLTNTADSTGQVEFKDSLAGSPQFYRIRTGSFTPPLVYSVENTGAGLAPPPLPTLEELPTIEPLTDPFEWSDGRGRVNNFLEWTHRRAEIKAEFEHYEVGTKPNKPGDITASYADNILTVNITVGGETLTLTSTVILPSGEGPFPAIIGINSPTGSLPADIFESRGIAQIQFHFEQVMAHTQTRGSEPINRLYPDQIEIGAYAAWPWGVSRLIDGLELVQEDLPIDLEHLGISGCSFAGKMALFAGAFDERIALTIAQEPGGGGAAAWRVSETIGDVEKLGATSHAWFLESMFQFSGENVSKLPMDHHELMAMVAPRALFVLGNTDYTWLAERSGYVSCRAAHEVWKTLNISDRFGFSIKGSHQHCNLPASQKPEVEAFVDKFLLGIETADTNITRNPFSYVNHTRWFEWWGTGEPVLAPES